MVLGATAVAASAAAGGSLFDYNRKNFLYDRKMRQETEYQIMDFRIKQAELWREDVRDIIGLTSVKMDTYLIVNAVQLGFCVMAFCEGRLAAGTPVWLIGCHTLSLSGAFMYLLMSVWLSMHASVTAKSYEVRLLTQHVRLPVPSWAQLEGARTYASGFEKVEPKQMFRMPFLMGTQEQVLQARLARQDASATAVRVATPQGDSPAGTSPASGDVSAAEAGIASGGVAESTDLWGLERRGDSIYELDGSLRADPKKLRHLKLVREAMQYWQSYDGFARVAMSMGTNQLIAALSYYVIGYVLISNHAVIASWLVVVLFMVIACALIRLDMSLTSLEYKISVLLVISGPLLNAVAAQQWARQEVIGNKIVRVLTPIVYVFHALWLMFLLHISKVSEQKGGAMLPTGFRSVMYIDVFGWIKRNVGQSALGGEPALPAAAQAAPVDAAARVSGCGPAVQSVRYEHGQPVPIRPEDLPGAAQQTVPSLEGLKRQDFEPTTFVPREKETDKEREASLSTIQPHLRPGFVPWRIFCAATTLLIFLWWVSAVFVLLYSCGIETFKVSPLLREVEDSGERSSLLQVDRPLLSGGVPIATSWPHARILPQSLACGTLAAAEGNATLAVSSRFGLFAATVQTSAPRANFQAAPPCEGIEGESLGDVGLSCIPGSDCEAQVLHQQGQRLTSCALFESPGSPSQEKAASTSISDGWLGDGNALKGVPQEEVSAIALSAHCAAGGGRCAFVETTRGRIAEVQMAEHRRADTSRAPPAREPDWFPTRILQAARGGNDWRSSGGNLHLVAGKYLGLLQRDQRSFELLRAEDGTALGQWLMPGKKDWSAMCSTGDALYFLTADPVPELWRFPVPVEFRPRDPPQPAPRRALPVRSMVERGLNFRRSRQTSLATD